MDDRIFETSNDSRTSNGGTMYLHCHQMMSNAKKWTFPQALHLLFDKFFNDRWRDILAIILINLFRHTNTKSYKKNLRFHFHQWNHNSYTLPDHQTIHINYISPTTPTSNKTHLQDKKTLKTSLQIPSKFSRCKRFHSLGVPFNKRATETQWK